jgi:plasmid stabilization system protein ParE
MRVRFNRRALADIDEIATYIAERNPRAAAETMGRTEIAGLQ